MALPTGTTALTKCEDKLRTALSESPAWQAFVGAANATDALAHIWVGELPDATGATDEYAESDWVDLFPLAIIEDHEGAIEFIHTSDGGPYGYIFATEIVLAFEAKRNPSQDNETAHRNFKNSCFEIVEELIGYSGSASGTKFYPSRLSHSPVGWHQPDVEGESDAMRIEFTFINEQQ